MTMIPTEIIFTHIFPILPPKTLLTLKCVCKSWQTYISSPEFITLHFNVSSYKKSHILILKTTQNTLLSVPLNPPPHFLAELPFPSSSDGVEKTVVGCCHGIVCVCQSGRGMPIWVANPCTGLYREIPALHLPRQPLAINYGFGYDHVNDEYKIVRLVDFYSSRTFLRDVCRQVSVYSLKLSAWRMVEWIVPYDSVKDGENGAVFNDHLVHWIVWCYESRKCRIRCFDIRREKWVDDVHLPDAAAAAAAGVDENGPEHRNGVLCLGVFDGNLFYSSKNEQQSDQINVVVDVWIMKEYGVKESWVKLLSISNARVARALQVSPVVYSNRGRKVLVRRGCDDDANEHKLCWYGFEDESIESAEFDGVGDCSCAYVCIESLVGVPGGSQFGMWNGVLNS